MSERLAHTLSGRLDELAKVAERSGAAAPVVARLLEAASMATMDAVALDLLTMQRASAAPRETEERPQVTLPAELREAA